MNPNVKKDFWSYLGYPCGHKLSNQSLGALLLAKCKEANPQLSAWSLVAKKATKENTESYRFSRQISAPILTAVWQN